MGKAPIPQDVRDEMKKKELDTIRNKMKNFEDVDKESMRKLGMTDKQMSDYIKAVQKSRQASIEEK